MTYGAVKGFTQPVQGLLGPWYQKVNEAVQLAQGAETAEQVREILGEPDHRESVPHDDRRLSKRAPIDPRYPSEYWTYVDPYRPRFHYRFGISAGRVVETSRHTHTG